MPPSRRVAYSIAAALVLLAVWQGWTWLQRPWRPSREELVTPKIALSHLKGRVVFAVGPGRDLLAKENALLLPEPARTATSTFSRAVVQSTQDPRLFRELDRQVRFDTLWLSGDPSSFKPLLEHLLKTGDFGPVWVDQTSILLQRGAPADAPLPDLAEVRALAREPRETAFLLAQAASRFVALRQIDEAAKLLTEAEKASPAVMDVWTAWAVLRMHKDEWDKALEASDRALRIDSDFLPAIACKAQCLYAAGRFVPAWRLSDRLVTAHPEDPTVLFYHSKLAHEARAFDSEIEALSKLISLAKAAGANVSGYRIYLAQAYAGKNDAENAKDQVTLALLDTTLPREQRVFADELLDQITRYGKK
jgi:tetratricopeptide (TPR) repeat protein